MIGFNALGQLGRLGNQMFQFAALKGIARHHGYQFCFPPSENKNEWTDHQLLIPFKMSSTNALNIQYIDCLLYTSPSPRDRTRSRMPSSA